LRPIDKNNKPFTMDSNKVPFCDPRKPFFRIKNGHGAPPKTEGAISKGQHDAVPARVAAVIIETCFRKEAVLQQLVEQAKAKLNPSGD
jgi:hypothetical protein